MHTDIVCFFFLFVCWFGYLLCHVLCLPDFGDHSDVASSFILKKQVWIEAAQLSCHGAEISNLDSCAFTTVSHCASFNIVCALHLGTTTKKTYRIKTGILFTLRYIQSPPLLTPPFLDVRYPPLSLSLFPFF